MCACTITIPPGWRWTICKSIAGTFDTLRSLILTGKDGSKQRVDLHIPTLEEYLDICRRYEKTSVLELKDTLTAADIEKIIGIARNFGWLEHVIFISFSLEAMQTVRRLLPDQPCQYLVEQYTDDLPELLQREKLDLDIGYPALTAQRVQELHARGIVVNCWTCDDSGRRRRAGGNGLGLHYVQYSGIKRLPENWANWLKPDSPEIRLFAKKTIDKRIH